MENHSLAPSKAVDPNAVPERALDTLLTLSQKQLLNLRHALDQRLNIEISQLNLTEELGLQFRQAKDLLHSVKDDPSIPTNQKAQVFNSVQGQLEKIIKLRQDVFSQERLKRFESALLKVLEQAGTNEQKETFLDLYGDFLRDKGE